jgi:hypothetical protein
MKGKVTVTTAEVLRELARRRREKAIRDTLKKRPQPPRK